MKTIVNKLLVLTFFSVALWGCKKDETLTTIANAKAPVLSSSANTLVLTATQISPILNSNQLDYKCAK